MDHDAFTEHHLERKLFRSAFVASFLFGVAGGAIGGFGAAAYYWVVFVK